LAGKYRVDRVLGVGGMGVVVAAHHIDLDEKVAIKFLLPQSLANKEAVARFAREARAAVKIKSEHVARVSDVGKLENGSPYMVMEYLEGGDLADWLSQRGALPVEQAVDFLLQACEAIAEAHSLGIVHRDLKPANLFIIRRADGQLSVKVLDFGISKMTGIGAASADGSMTKTSSLMGSPLYMSPEQMQTPKDVDSRSDIWAIGVILHELLTGNSPFIAETMPELVLKIVSSPPPPLRAGRPDAPDGLEAVLRRCLEKDRGKRYETVGELALALMQFGSKRARGSVERISGVMRGAGMSSSALAMPPSSDVNGQAGPAGPAGTAASWGQTGAKAGGGRGTLVWIGGAVLVVGLGSAVFLGKGPSSKDGAVPSAGGAGVTTPSAARAGDEPESEQGSPQPPPSAGFASPVPSATAGPTPAASVSPSVTTGTPSTPRPTGGRVIVRPPPPPPAAAPPPSAKPQVAKPTPKPNCEPNFYFDAQGEKHFKPECFK
jgi:serine/threonine-protein kinase